MRRGAAGALLRPAPGAGVGGPESPGGETRQPQVLIRFKRFGPDRSEFRSSRDDLWKGDGAAQVEGQPPTDLTQRLW